MVSIKDIIMAASGKDEQGYNKSAVGLFFERIDIDGNSTVIDEVDVDKPIINIFKSFNKVQVDIIYSYKNDIDLKMMNDLLIKATNAENSVEDNASDFPLISLSIIPHEFDGKFYILCTDPIVWCLTAQDPRGDIDTLRMVFDENDFNVLATDDEALAMVNTQIEEEIAEEERNIAFYEEKELAEQEKRRKQLEDNNSQEDDSEN